MPNDWIYGLIGGGLIGLAAATYLLVNGRIMGVTGIVAGLFRNLGSADWAERALFVAGLLAAPVIYRVAGGDFTIDITSSLPLLVAGGLLVGFGTRMGSGCTSGHGICGMPRLSRRSLIAVPVFMATGIATVTLMTYL